MRTNFLKINGSKVVYAATSLARIFLFPFASGDNNKFLKNLYFSFIILIPIILIIYILFSYSIIIFFLFIIIIYHFY